MTGPQFEAITKWVLLVLKPVEKEEFYPIYIITMGSISYLNMFAYIVAKYGAFNLCEAAAWRNQLGILLMLHSSGEVHRWVHREHTGWRQMRA